MTYNVDLMLQVREQITAHPETHDQESWVSRTDCGTTMCIAGWATALVGMKVVEDADWTYLVQDPGSLSPVRHISVVAQELLGLSPREAGDLFSNGPTNAEALALLDRFIDAGKNGTKVCLD